MNIHDCTCNQGRCACACGKTINQKNSDGSDPHDDDISPFAVQTLALAVAAAITAVLLLPFVAGAIGRYMGWL